MTNLAASPAPQVVLVSGLGHLERTVIGRFPMAENHVLAWPEETEGVEERSGISLPPEGLKTNEKRDQFSRWYQNKFHA